MAQLSSEAGKNVKESDIPNFISTKATLTATNNACGSYKIPLSDFQRGKLPLYPNNSHRINFTPIKNAIKLNPTLANT
jgi:hypothetical protein